jgi:hypothetical protein
MGGKTRRKMVAVEKNMTCFQQAALIGKIDVIKMSGKQVYPVRSSLIQRA